jgi:hypothetical protein
MEINISKGTRKLASTSQNHLREFLADEGRRDCNFPRILSVEDSDFKDQDTGGEWSCPDFVALDFRRKEVSVVEVSSGYDIGALAEKVKNKELQWLEKLKLQLIRNEVIDGTRWNFSVKIFIRRDRYEAFKNKIGPLDKVHTVPLEDLGFPWHSEWHNEA